MKDFRVIRLVSVVLLALWLTGCGFQLRSAPDWPEGRDAIALQGVPAGSAFGDALRGKLLLSGLTVLPAVRPEYPQLRIIDLRRDRRTATVRAGRVDEYEWTSRLQAELRLPEREGVIPLGELSVRRLFRENPAAVLGQTDDEMALLVDMEHELARLLHLRLQAVLQQPYAPSVR